MRLFLKKALLSIFFLFLLTTGAECRDYPLLDAAKRGDTGAVGALLDKGYDVNMSDGNGYTALHLAACNERTEMVKFLLKRGAKVDPLHFAQYTPLIEAAFRGYRETAQALIEGGANTDMAIAKLESYPSHYSDAFRAKAAIKLIEKLIPQKAAAAPPPAASISREDLQSIVQATLEGAAKSQRKEAKPASVKTDIDSPAIADEAMIMSDRDLAVIIGIEGYSNLPKSDYSYDDARLVKDYVKALGIKERNIELITDEKATLSGIAKAIEAWLKNKAREDSRVFVYYSGHGAPDPATGDAYLVPFDGDPNYLGVTGYSLKRLYAQLGQLHVKEVVVVLDTCFSGSGGRSVLAQGARPLVMVAETAALSSHVAVLTATQGGQISTSSSEKGHGIFTYFFLKALKEGKKNLAEIYECIKPQVEDEAKQLNVQQSPSINPKPEKLSGRFSLRK